MIYKKSIQLAGSSFLNPAHKAWDILKEYHELTFYDYGNWSKSLLDSKSSEVLVLVMYLADIMDRKSNFEETKIKIGVFFDLLKDRLIRAEAPTIVAFASGIEENLIHRAQNLTVSSKVYYSIFENLDLLTKEYPALYFIDLDKEFGFVGINNCFDLRNWYFAHCRASARGLYVITNSINRILSRLVRPYPKVLVLDCDNTLWGGVVGEDGVEGIVLGQDGLGKAFTDFQYAIKNLKDEGVLLALASKNNEDDVWAVFKEHGEMILKKEDIVSWKINWQDKTVNIKEIATELDLSLESFLFWDDNPIEREKMKNSNPEVITIDPPEEVFNWSNYLIHLDQLAKFRINSDDLVKSEQYKIRANFVRDIGNVKDEFAYLKSINITPTTSALNSSNIGRAAQLCAKTNQYNLRTARHSAQTLLKIAEGHRNICFLVGMSDLYGDHGQVALVCVTEYNDEVAFLDTFLMSCRVLGRHLEAWILKKILNKCRAIGYKQLLGEFISTNRNQPASSFFTDYCFKPVPMGILNEIGANSNKLHFEGQLFVLPTDFSNIPKLDIYEGQD